MLNSWDFLSLPNLKPMRNDWLSSNANSPMFTRLHVCWVLFIHYLPRWILYPGLVILFLVNVFIFKSFSFSTYNCPSYTVTDLTLPTIWMVMDIQTEHVTQAYTLTILNKCWRIFCPDTNKRFENVWCVWAAFCSLSGVFSRGNGMC